MVDGLTASAPSWRWLADTAVDVASDADVDANDCSSRRTAVPTWSSSLALRFFAASAACLFLL